MVGRVFSDGTIQLSINADTADYVVFTAAGSPGAKADVVVTIASGVVVYQSGGTAALRTGTFASGSKVKIINRGTICAKGGAGGAGGGGGSAGSNGSGGGDALRHEGQTLEIDNTAGYILGGGGGAGGGEGTTIGGAKGGGGGGGGRGRIDSSGGAGGTATTPGSPGAAGTFSGGGAGGAPGGVPAAWGGDGGDWGTQGEAGGEVNQPPSTGGAGGYAVRIALGTVVWLGGYDSSRVQGGVG